MYLLAVVLFGAGQVAVCCSGGVQFPTPRGFLSVKARASSPASVLVGNSSSSLYVVKAPRCRPANKRCGAVECVRFIKHLNNRQRNLTKQFKLTELGDGVSNGVHPPQLNCGPLGGTGGVGCVQCS